MSHENPEETLEAAIEWVRRKWGETRPCPYCGDPTWEVGSPFELMRPSGDGIALVFPVTCVECGSTTLIDVDRAGLA